MEGEGSKRFALEPSARLRNPCNSFNYTLCEFQRLTHLPEDKVCSNVSTVQKTMWSGLKEKSDVELTGTEWRPLACSISPAPRAATASDLGAHAAIVGADAALVLGVHELARVLVHAPAFLLPVATHRSCRWAD